MCETEDCPMKHFTRPYWMHSYEGFENIAATICYELLGNSKIECRCEMQDGVAVGEIL
jgi:hypothetical protein